MGTFFDVSVAYGFSAAATAGALLLLCSRAVLHVALVLVTGGVWWHFLARGVDSPFPCTITPRCIIHVFATPIIFFRGAAIPRLLWRGRSIERASLAAVIARRKERKTH